MIELYQLGVVDKRAVLENVGLPPEDYEKILARVEMQEQQQMLAAQGMPPGEAGGAHAGAPEGGPQSPPPTEDELNQLEQS